MSKLNIEDIFIGETVRVKNNDYEYYVKVHLIDEDSGRAYCADEVLGISMWHDIENLEKLTTENTSKENDDEITTFMDKLNKDDEFLAFVEALREVAEFNGIDVPQVEVDEEPNVVDDDPYWKQFEEDGELYLHLESKDFIKKHNVKIESITVHKHFDWAAF